MAVAAPEAVGVVAEATPRRHHRGILGWIGQAVSWFLMFAIGAVLVLSVVLPRAFGATTFIIETGSMRPHLPPGTMVAVKRADPASIGVGDVITYQLRSGDPTVVTHRVIAVGYNSTGEMRWQTQGDANTAPDENWVMTEQLRGRLWFGVPMLGRVTSIITKQQHGLIVVAFVLGLASYAIGQFGSAWRDRRRTPSPHHAAH